MLVTDIITYAARMFNVTVEDIMSDTRRGPVMRARLALYAGLCLRLRRKGNRRCFTPIGRWLGRHHSSVLIGERRALKMMAADPTFAALVERIASATEESACKLELQVLPAEASATHTERSNLMAHPEHVEDIINTRLKADKSRISVYWNGDFVGRDEPAILNVFFGDDETRFQIELGRDVQIVEQVAPRHYQYIASARYYVDCAEILKDMAESGDFAEYEEEDA